MNRGKSRYLGGSAAIFIVLSLGYPLVLFLSQDAHAAEAGCSLNKKEPNVSGQFYPAEADKLKAMVSSFISGAEVEEHESQPVGLIAPHAGYVYSGAVAGYAYKALSGARYDTVVVMAPSHFARFKGAAVWSKGCFLTPLGGVAVDEESAQRLISLNRDVKDLPEVFQREHSLEVELPFLQCSLRDFKLLPIIIGDMNLDSCLVLAGDLCKILSHRKALVIASTDLSHYLGSVEAGRTDSFTLSVICSGDAKRLYEGGLSKAAQLCGIMPVTVLLEYARQQGYMKPVLLKHADSGDVTGERSRVVGYASLAVYPSLKEAGKDKAEGEYKGEARMFNDAQRKELIKIARSSIETYLKTGKRIQIKETDPVLLKERGCFVTLRENGRLRGCIGSLTPSAAVCLLVRDMAVQAAVGDPRFPPLQLAELKGIDIEISVLSPMERVGSADEVIMGKHGVLIRKGGRSGVFLPQVADETGWSKEDFLSNLCLHKAGLSPAAWKEKDTEIYVFSAEVFGEKEG